MKNFEPTASLWQLGFRPFFLFGSLHALLAMLLWIAYLTGWLPRIGYLDPILWHSHEMIYGFTAAIIGGFVLTASQNWTGKRGVNGKPLQFLVALWVLGRVLVSIPGAPGILTAVIDLSFFPVLSFLMVPYLKDPDLRTERVFFLFFALFFTGNLLVHLQALGILQGYARSGVYLGLNTVVLVIIFMGGRVIPFFTESSVSRKQPKTWQGVELTSHVSAGLFLVADLFLPSSLPLAIIAFVAAGVHLVRLSGWYAPRIRRAPLIWVLHVGYLWLVIGFALSGLATLGLIAKTPALHAFTVGGLGVIIYGMISRVALGHTGRRLHPQALVVAGFYLLNFSAVFRVFGPIFLPNLYLWTLVMSAVLWIAAFFLYLLIYSPMLLAPRLDRRPG